MKKRTFKKTKEELISECQEIMHRNKVNHRFLRRVTAVNMFLNGMKQNEICKINGISKLSLMKWLDIVEKQGIEGLKDKAHEGRKPRLTDLQLAEVKSALENAPSENGYNIWDGPSLSDFIQKKFGVFLCVQRCQYMMHEMGVRVGKF